MNGYDKWIYFLKHTKELSIIPKEFKNIKEFEEAFKITIQYSWNKKELDVYDYITLKNHDEINMIKTAEKKGKKEGKIEVVENMLSANIDIETIILSTGLSKG